MLARVVRSVGIAVALLLVAQAGAALSPADKCEAAKLKIAGKYNFCRLKAHGDAHRLAAADERVAARAQAHRRYELAIAHNARCRTRGQSGRGR